MDEDEGAGATITTTRTYIGRRQDAAGKIVYAYLDEEGSLGLYSKPLTSSHAVGSIVMLTYTDETRKSYWSGGERRPKITGLADSDAKHLIEWQVADRAAYQAKLEADAMKRQVANAANYQKSIDTLVFAASSLGGAQKAAFARYVADRIRGL